jgi:hypothetical protein
MIRAAGATSPKAKAPNMTPLRSLLRFALIVALGFGSLLFAAPALAASPQSIPPIIEAGFAQWAKSGPALALDVWQKGGLLEGDDKINTLAHYLRRLDRALGNYKGYEWIDTKPISTSSETLYVSINFERGAVYGRFLLYRADKTWVVQNIDLSTRPETIMPWLAFAGANYSE